MKSDNSFLKGTLILTVSSIVVKVIGALAVCWAGKASVCTRWVFLFT